MHGIARPIRAGMSHAKIIAARSHFAYVHIKSQNNGLVLQVRCTSGSKDRSSRFTQQRNFVFLVVAPNGKSRIRYLTQRCNSRGCSSACSGFWPTAANKPRRSKISVSVARPG